MFILLLMVMVTVAIDYDYAGDDEYGVDDYVCHNYCSNADDDVGYYVDSGDGDDVRAIMLVMVMVMVLMVLVMVTLMTVMALVMVRAKFLMMVCLSRVRFCLWRKWLIVRSRLLSLVVRQTATFSRI